MRGEPGPHVRIIKAEALSKLVLVIPAPDELRDLPGKKEEEAERVKQIVEKPDHKGERTWARCRNKTSVAPYFFARLTTHNPVAGIFSAGRFSRTNTPDGSSIPANWQPWCKRSVNSPPACVISKWPS